MFNQIQELNKIKENSKKLSATNKTHAEISSQNNNSDFLAKHD